MSYSPAAGYCYDPSSTPYYLDDADHFIAAAYTDGEGVVPDNQQQQNILATNPDLTEIYTRKAPIPSPPAEAGYHHHNPYVPEYYYDNLQQRQQHSQNRAPLPENVFYDPQSQQFYHQRPMHHDGGFGNAAVFNRSNPQLGGHHQGFQERVVQTVNLEKSQGRNAKRYPITVSTPRYYRKPAASFIYKRPSALCLPVISQPDPATNRRSKRPTNEPQMYRSQEVTFPPEIQDLNIRSGHSSGPDMTKVTHKTNSEGDANLNVGNLETMLSNFEKEAMNFDVNDKANIAEISRYFKPKIPSSIKSKLKLKLKGTKLQEKPRSDEIDNVMKEQVQELPTNPLEALLNQLKKCECPNSKDNLEKCDTKSNQHECANKNVTNNEPEKVKNTIDPLQSASASKSFNYQDITDHLYRSKSECEGPNAETAASSQQEVTIQNSTCQQKRRSSGTSFKPLDDNCALELHRSKSYIVNLIDKALSKELGTVPGEKYNRREFDNMNPKKAMDLMNRHTCETIDKNFCLEITTALTDSIISTATAPEGNPKGCGSKMCCCRSEEPIYIKQLKQLRWGHLKHIQREVKRLEELERFLDSCGGNSSCD